MFRSRMFAVNRGGEVLMGWLSGTRTRVEGRMNWELPPLSLWQFQLPLVQLRESLSSFPEISEVTDGS